MVERKVGYLIRNELSVSPVFKMTPAESVTNKAEIGSGFLVREHYINIRYFKLNTNISTICNT